MTTVRFSPLTDSFFDALAAGRWPEAVEELFLGSSSAPTGSGGAWVPEYELSETDQAYRVHVDLPGVKPDAVNLQLHGGVLTLSGKREAPGEDVRHLRRESRRGEFQLALRVPNDVLTDEVDAASSNGVLTVTLPKRPEETPRKIDVKQS